MMVPHGYGVFCGKFNMSEPACYRVSNVAARWHCSTGKVRSLIRSGELPILRLAIDVSDFPDAQCFPLASDMPMEASRIPTVDDGHPSNLAKRLADVLP